MGQKKFVDTFSLAELVAADPSESEILNDIVEVLNLLADEVIGKKIVYFYKKNMRESQKKLEVCFTEESILHLLGISYYDNERRVTIESLRAAKNARLFYSDFKAKNLNYEKCWVESLNKVKDKVTVLRHIADIKTSKVRIGENGQLRTIPLTNTLSTPKIGLGIALHHDCPDYSIPRSCLNLAADREAKSHASFRKTARCIKIWIYQRNQGGGWKLIDKIDCSKELQDAKSKKKKKNNKKKNKERNKK